MLIFIARFLAYTDIAVSALAILKTEAHRPLKDFINAFLLYCLTVSAGQDFDTLPGTQNPRPSNNRT